MSRAQILKLVRVLPASPTGVLVRVPTLRVHIGGTHGEIAEVYILSKADHELLGSQTREDTL